MKISLLLSIVFGVFSVKAATTISPVAVEWIVPNDRSHALFQEKSQQLFFYFQDPHLQLLTQSNAFMTGGMYQFFIKRPWIIRDKPLDPVIDNDCTLVESGHYLVTKISVDTIPDYSPLASARPSRDWDAVQAKSQLMLTTQTNELPLTIFQVTLNVTRSFFALFKNYGSLSLQVLIKQTRGSFFKKLISSSPPIPTTPTGYRQSLDHGVDALATNLEHCSKVIKACSKLVNGICTVVVNFCSETGIPQERFIGNRQTNTVDTVNEDFTVVRRSHVPSVRTRRLGRDLYEELPSSDNEEEPSSNVHAPQYKSVRNPYARVG